MLKHTDLLKKNKLNNRLLVKSCIEENIGNRTEELSRLFYKELFHLDINLKTVFPGNVVFLNRKFSNMLATLKNVKHLEKVIPSIEKIGERHIQIYGAQIEHFDSIKTALLLALNDFLGDKYTHELKDAWIDVFDDVAKIMEQAMSKIDKRQNQRKSHDESGYDPNLLNEIGGAEVITQIHKSFYDVMFEHPWLGQFFYGKSKTTLIRKQTEFMVAAFNGPNHYTGDTPAFVHMHMFITEEMAKLREEILKTAILDQGLSNSIADRWLKVDHSFHSSIVKNSIDECVLKCKGQVPITAKKTL